MIIRKRLYPKRISDAATTLFVFAIIPTVYYFELFIVLPTFYSLWSPWYTFHFTLGTYILINIVSNYVAVQLCDTSINGRMLEVDTRSNWKFCSVCEALTPPRSWHCKICDVCILKRDHHCMFASYCIGHYNLRYFFMFVLYLFIATVYATYYNVIFISNNFTFEFSWLTLVHIVFPFATLFVKFTKNQAYLTLVIIVIIASVFSGVLLIFHTRLMILGQVTKENEKKINKYDRGTWWKNVQEVLGDKWHLVWISPFVHSKLSQDGIKWITNEAAKEK